ncbi:UDPGP type 1 family protein [Paenibacillus doosanensis]|uniref:UDPGP type 1 family protein n=1 Tax=Paenibacillus doosanensis TaxID=1229154 RepID=UPI0021800DD0|nr:UDPGP type 1 family protein [Paenibacillus doosanensis]MCS7459313.1 UDPGP type 1 family protein [Paenibacillus doosanensis]
MEGQLEQAKAILSQYGQEHLLRYYDTLPDESKRKLLKQVLKIDYARLNAIRGAIKPVTEEGLAGEHMAPMDGLSLEELTQEQRRNIEELGWTLLREGKVGAIVVAGGQGSRLGYDGPKGTYDIGLPSGKSLFQLQAERLLNLSGRAGRTIPWYIMTSPENHEETVRFFEASRYFGFPREHCRFFQQEALPALDEEGKIVMAAQDEISLAPSGNGDCFAALKRSGLLAEMKLRGLRWLFYYNVDNALVRVADPLFVGAAERGGHPLAAKAVEKSHPGEKVGILCWRGGHPAVVEYTVIPERVMNERDRSGKLVYGMGNVSMQLFRIDFIEKAADAELPFDMAHKAIPCIGGDGERIVPDRPNAYKFERFIFDAFPLADRITVLKVNPEEEFAPVKNKEGADSPATARELTLALHRKWLLRAGVAEELLASRSVEISPLVSYAGEGLTPQVLRSLGL